MTKPARAAKLTVKYLPTNKLVPYARNSRTHSPAQVAQIAASIREFGFTNPVLVDAADGIIAGHGRVLAAQMLELAEVPTIELTGLTEAQKRAYVIADNKLALNSGWDESLLAVELADLHGDGYDLSLTGFDAAELGKLFGDEAVEDAAPADTAGSYSEQYGVIVICRDEIDQKSVYERLLADGLNVKVVAT